MRPARLLHRAAEYTESLEILIEDGWQTATFVKDMAQKRLYQVKQDANGTETARRLIGYVVANKWKWPVPANTRYSQDDRDTGSAWINDE